QDLWERRQFRHEHLLTEDGRRVSVEFPGLRSREGGPDFRGARLLLDGRPCTGDVELHLVPSGWKAHGHDADGAYARVILHVVLRREPFRETPGCGAPVLVLEPYLRPAAAPWDVVLAGDWDAGGEAWYRARRARIERALERAEADEVLHREILVALGYKHNKAAMAELARRCPLAALPSGAGEIEARLREEARRLPPALWRLRHVRPANRPERRLAGYARFLAAARPEGLARGLAARPGLEAMTAWLDPDGTGLIGARRALEIALNVFVPFLGDAVWRDVADRPPPPLPGPALRAAGTRPATVRRYFGALRAYREEAFSLATPHPPG
ncbi:MAG TPA: DUF2851 family protein, partial [Planctomycetota bacterium]|nr:DUF2851 family protein [Planctomycetota bacterium]